VYLYVLYGSQNKQLLFPYTAFTDWFLQPRWSVLLRGTDWIFIYNTLKPQWLLYVPPGLTLKNATFCPHSVFMCFVRSENKQRLFPNTARIFELRKGGLPVTRTASS
jgi:hypothetical protein